MWILQYNLIIFGTIVKRITTYTKKFYWRNFMDWNEIQNVLSNAVFAILLIAMVIYWVNLLLFNDKSYLSTFGRISTSIATLFLFFILCSRWIVAGYFPLSNLYESLLFLTWILLATYLYIETKTSSRLIGAIVVPITLLISGFANLTLSPEMQKASPLVPALQSNWLMMHVSMMLLSYGTLIMGSLLCILFLVISDYKDVDLKSTDVSSSAFYNVMLDYYEAKLISSSSEVSDFGKLKLLQSIDNWSYRIIGLGFPFLTIGIISGGVWANEAWGSYWSWDPKETWALITWLVFATYLHARITKGWEGKKTAILGGLGFFVIWICYLGVNFLGKGLHSYGWVS
jgi:cytochrome c-type biogenesis protein CcsB|uniref:heme attachment to plastid cytochrome c n=1 Tax=Pseudo-nitzschia cuspidata TaxID=237455 RepID=UPI001D10AF19|nr:heme attachment to plastid cytochrome c [Pseudo-nitzschia cuspidata]UBA15433.1 heme attachment to plastid cytochrome c [Pseudo-nitzschia cuspidata]